MAFLMMAASSVFFLAALVVGERMLGYLVPRQTGDSSLSYRSVNWMGGLALFMAVLIILA